MEEEADCSLQIQKTERRPVGTSYREVVFGSAEGLDLTTRYGQLWSDRSSLSLGMSRAEWPCGRFLYKV